MNLSPRHPTMAAGLWLTLAGARAPDGFEASDAATFAFVALGLWVARRALRQRFGRRGPTTTKRD